MTGYLKVDVAQENGGTRIRCACEIENASLTDRLRVVHTVLEALNINEFDLELYKIARDAGFMDRGEKTYPKSAEELYNEG